MAQQCGPIQYVGCGCGLSETIGASKGKNGRPFSFTVDQRDSPFVNVVPLSVIVSVETIVVTSSA